MVQTDPALQACYEPFAIAKSPNAKKEKFDEVVKSVQAATVPVLGY